MTALVRTPTVTDAAAIARVHTESWREAYGGIFPGSYFDAAALERRIGLWTRALEAPAPGETLRVAEVDGEITGFALAGPSRDADAPRDRELYSIYLLAAEHGSGAGQLLLDEALGDAPASLWVLAGNRRALAFYRRNGFESDGVEREIPFVPGFAEIRMLR